MNQDFSMFNTSIPSQIVFVCKKPMKVIAITQMLEKIGHKVNVVSGIYDAIKEIESDLPRLIISEYETTDGNLIHLLDKIEKNPYTSHIPVVAILDTANSANMGQLKDRNIKEFFKPKSNPKDIVLKSHTIINGQSYSSYFRDVSDMFNSNETQISMTVTLIGRIGCLLVLDTPKALEVGCNLNVHKKSDPNHSFRFKPIYNIENSQSVLSFVPIHTLRGDNAEWVLNVNKLKSDEDMESRPRVVVFSKDNNDTTGMVDLLNVSGFLAEGALNYDALIKFISRNQKETVYGVVLENPNETDLSKFFKLYKTLKNKPRLVISSDKKISLPDNIVNLVQPYDLDSFIDSMNAIFAVDDKFKLESASNLELEMSRTVKLIAVDCSGGILESSSSLAPGIDMEVENDAIVKLFRGQSLIRIVSSIKSNNTDDSYFIKFDIPGASDNKIKYIENIEKSVIEIKEEQSKAS